MKSRILRIASITSMRSLIKLCILLFDCLTKWIPFGSNDVLFMYDFDSHQQLVADQLSSYQVRSYRFNLKTIIQTTYWARRSRVIYVDNMNIVIATLKLNDTQVIQYWHATSAIKQFGLPTVTDDEEYQIRHSEFQKYSLIAVNSEFMKEKFMNGFGVNEERIAEVGCLQSMTLFTGVQTKPEYEYIVYVPTFRWNPNDNQEAISFIENYKHPSVKLVYSIHPKVECQINNSDTIRVDGDQIRNYFKNAKLIISDYSSLLVDASLLNAHTVMYAYDVDKYQVHPGLYVDKSNFWGYYCTSCQQLLKYVENDEYISHDQNKIKDRFFTFDDSQSYKRIANLAIDYLEQRG